MNTQFKVLSWLEIPRYDMRAPGSRGRQMTCDVDRTNKHFCLELQELVPSLLIVTKVPKVWILNPKSEIVWNLKSKIGLRSKIQNMTYEIQSQISEIQNMKNEIQNLKFDLKSDIKKLKPEIWNLKYKIWNLNSNSKIRNLKKN